MFPGLKNYREKQNNKIKQNQNTKKTPQEHRGFKKELSAKKKKGTRNSEHLFHLSRYCKTVRQREMCMDC